MKTPFCQHELFYTSDGPGVWDVLARPAPCVHRHHYHDFEEALQRFHPSLCLAFDVKPDSGTAGLFLICRSDRVQMRTLLEHATGDLPAQYLSHAREVLTVIYPVAWRVDRRGARGELRRELHFRDVGEWVLRDLSGWKAEQIAFDNGRFVEKQLKEQYVTRETRRRKRAAEAFDAVASDWATVIDPGEFGKFKPSVRVNKPKSWKAKVA